MQTTVDPSYIISLIRKLLPRNNSNANLLQPQTVRDLETSNEGHTVSPTSGGPNNNAISSVDEAAWEESGCILWDLAVNNDHVVFMVCGFGPFSHQLLIKVHISILDANLCLHLLPYTKSNVEMCDLTF